MYIGDGANTSGGQASADSKMYDLVCLAQKLNAKTRELRNRINRTPEGIAGSGGPKESARPTLHDSLNEALSALREAHANIDGVSAEFGISQQPEVIKTAGNY